MSKLFLILLVAVLYALACDANTLSRSKRRMNLVPTLTVDVSPSHTQIPVPFDTGKPKEYYFPVGQLFNVSCVIKNPSFMDHLAVSRRSMFNNGSLDEKVELLHSRGYAANPDFPNQKERLQVQTQEFYPDYDQQSRHIRVSVIMKALDISDTGFYKCEYQQIVKEIKIIVFKQAHSKSITFPVDEVKTVTLGESTPIACKVSDVYPKATVSFILPDGKAVSNKDVNNTDLSPKEPYFLYSEQASINYTPVYSAHGKNLTCSVFSIGSTNLTVEKTLTLDVNGFSLIKYQCQVYFTGSLNDLDVEYSCTYFANPKVEPKWFTSPSTLELINNQKTKIATSSLDSSKLEDQVKNNMKSSVVKTVAAAVNSTEVKDVAISSEESSSSNYVSSIEDLGNGLYAAKLKLKRVSVEDYKDFKLKFTVDNKVVEHVVALKKTGYKKRVEAQLGGSASVLSSNIVHSTLTIVVTSLFTLLSR